jgi:hypothetical protein
MSEMIEMTEDNNIIIETPMVAKKRGRKSKKEIELALQAKNEACSQNNINVLIEETQNENEETQNKTGKNIEEIIISSNFINEDEDEAETDDLIKEKPIAKKRGRKPKGGKIIQQIVPFNNNKEPKPNVILHLKCSLKDLNLNSQNIDSDIQSYNFQNAQPLSYDMLNAEKNIFNKNYVINHNSNSNNNNNNNHNNNPQPKIIEEEIEYEEENDDKENDVKEVWKKLKILEHNLHINNICDKKSACFWCTYEFDNPPVYIPKHFIKESYHVYGCFCSPECATAHLMEENIDSSSKFERYHLINHIYSKIYDYKKNVKPAPNPYYMLDKYYGNLTIQEYRSLLKNERLFLIVDKPLTRILPELHEDNDDFIINNKIIPSNAYQIKKKLQKKQTKNNILTERFGLSQH